jgi:UDPglucose 6-dehydrogenase
MRISVFGAGRVGVPTAASLARLGHQVTVVDVERARVEALVRGTLPFHERGQARVHQRGRDDPERKPSCLPVRWHPAAG